MKLLNEAAPVETFGVSETSSFSIAMNSKAFRVLSDTLYQNKIGSIVREISCNAYDAHVMAGKPEVPFTIHLPNAFEPWFSVQDYGIGLSPEDIKTVFTVYFQSTKDQSNDAIGAFGLGAKTPFAYTDQFTVTSVTEGMKRIYSCFISGSGVPDIALMDESPSEEQNGVEIRLSAKREDYSRFADEVIDQLNYFKVKPILLNTHHSFKARPESYAYESDQCKIHNSGSDHLIAIQGNVGYPIDFDQLVNSTVAANFESAIEFLRTLRRSCVEFYFPIGSIGVTASREGIEYDVTTVTNILSAAAHLESDFFKKLEETMQNLPNDWERCFKLQSHPMSMRYANKLNLAPQFKIDLYRLTAHVHMSDVTKKTQKVSQILANGTATIVDAVVQVCEISNVSNFVRNSRRVRSNLRDTLDVCDKERLVFIMRDKSTLAERKISHYLSKLPPNSRVYEVTLTDSSLTYEKLVEKIRKHLTFDAKCVMLSSIELPEQLKPAITRQGAAQYYRWTPSVGTSNNSLRMWDVERAKELTSIVDDVYYITHDGSSCSLVQLQTAIDAMVELDLDPENCLIMISAKKEALIIDKPNFHSIEDLQNKAKAKLQSEVLRLKKEFRRLDLLQKIQGATSDYRTIIEMVGNSAEGTDFGKLIKTSEKVREKANLVNSSYYKVQNKLKSVYPEYEKIAQRNQKLADKFHATIMKYPLLKYVTQSYYYRSTNAAEAVVQYVKAIDSYSQSTVNV